MDTATRPSVAVVGLPEVRDLLPGAGHRALTLETHPAAVAAAAKAAEAAGEPYVVVAGDPDERTRAWLSLQAANGKRVIVLAGPDRRFDPDVPGCRTLPLPTVLDRVLHDFGAGTSGTDAGATVIRPDGSTGEVVPDLGPYLPAPDQHPGPTGDGQHPAAGLFETSLDESTSRDDSTAPRRGYAPVLVVCGFRGGVGKSSLALQLAERAATVGNLKRVVLVDANRGQGDIRTMLGLPPSAGSVYTAAIRGEPRRALLAPDQVAALRPEGLAPVSFGLALAPTRDQCDPRTVTCGVYSQVVKLAREHSDLVVVDTQIKEGHDTAGLFDSLVVPMMLAGAWTVCVTDTSRAGANNIAEGIELDLARQGVSRDRLLVVVNRRRASFTDEKVARFADLLAPFASFAGVIDNDDAGIGDLIEAGRIPHRHPQVSAVTDSVLHRVTGRSEFAPARAEVQRRHRTGRWRR